MKSKAELIDFVKWITKQDKKTLSMKTSDLVDLYLKSINSEHQIEAPNVIENEQKENICRNEKCILRHSVGETCSINAVACHARQI